MQPDSLGTSILLLLFLIALFFIGRRIMLWYWNINTIIKKQEEIADIQEISVKQLNKISGLLYLDHCNATITAIHKKTNDKLELSIKEWLHRYPMILEDYNIKYNQSDV